MFDDSTEMEPVEIEDPSEIEDEESSTPVKYDITSYGADYPVDGLVKRLSAGDIILPAFQRGFVWSLGQASRFIESLLLGLPVPGIFLSRDYESQQQFVIDGQQRLMTLLHFYEGLIREKEFKLKGVREDLDGLTYRSLEDEDRRRLDDSIIHATIVRQNDPKDDHSSIFMIFERLNTGGTPLSSQEIRSCVFHGAFSELLKSLNTNQAWRTIYGSSSERMKDEELILRFFSLYYDLDNYRRPMKLFLSNFMDTNRKLEVYDERELTNTFIRTVEFAASHLGPRGFRPEKMLNASVTDSILVATAEKLSQKPIEDVNAYVETLAQLIQKPEFIERCRTGTTDEENVRGRINIAKEALRDIH
jgi:uncharacterized protein with ParB-like and HNH nuclease domain